MLGDRSGREWEGLGRIVVMGKGSGARWREGGVVEPGGVGRVGCGGGGMRTDLREE